MAEYEALKRKRSQIKGALTRIVTFIQNSNDDTTLEEINLRLDMLDKVFTNFEEIEDKILCLPGTTSEMEEFERRYYDTKISLKNMAKVRTIDLSTSLNETFSRFTENQLNIVEKLSDRTTNHDTQQEPRLPRLNIPQFTGRYSDFPSFKDLYESSVHKNTHLSKVHKFQLLKGLLRDEALSLVRHIAVTDVNYDEAWTKLVDRYDKKRHVIHSHIKTFMEQTTISSLNVKSLRSLCDVSDEALRGLRALGTEAEQRDPWLIFILLSKLDPETRQLWAQNSVDEDFPSIKQFLDFLSKRCDALENCELSTKKGAIPRTTIKAFQTTAATTSTTNIICPKCSENHFLYKCSAFTGMNISNRRSFVLEKQLCFNCLSPTHQVTRCHCRYSCHHCRKRHHTLLHIKNEASTSNMCICNDTNQIQSTTTTQTSTVACTPPDSLMSAVVLVKDFKGQFLPCRVLLDSGSQASFISEACIQKLNLPRQNARIPITGLATKGAVTRGWTTIHIVSSHNSTYYLDTNVLILQKLPSSIPQQKIDIVNWEFVSKLQLADPSFNQPNQIDILIGADRIFNIFKDGRVFGPKGSLVAQNTIFGWIVSGEPSNTNFESTTPRSTLNILTDTTPTIDEALRRFWEIEEIIDLKNTPASEDDCEKHYKKHVQRHTSGKYIVKLPFVEEKQDLGESLPSAISRFYAVERKLQNNPSLKQEYTKFMSEYLKLEHMSPIPPEDIKCNVKHHFYLPHHSVTKESSTTTKVRVVFDGSSRSSTGISLNQQLLVGPTVQDDILSILLRFRIHPIAFSADIEKMYRQILIATEDRDYQRIVWREDPTHPLQHYRLNTVTYGTASAPYLATRTLNQISDDYKNQFPDASKMIKNDFYVDDLLSGANSETEAIRIAREVVQVLEFAGLKLRKWASNSPALLQSIPHLHTESEVTVGNDETIKLLGIMWNPNSDSFIFKKQVFYESKVTKRKFLSEGAQIFDPLGWISPTTILIKILFQKLWLHGIQWDDNLPQDIENQWMSIKTQLAELEDIHIQRCITSTGKAIQYHGFCDASEVAYAAVIYCRDEDDFGKPQIRIVTAKAKVAPIKQISLPRLELCGALLLSKLFQSLKKAIPTQNARLYAWTDSTIRLSWLSAHPIKWKTFIANRTTEILNHLPREIWNHVRSADNPADHASRGVTPANLSKLHQWWNGPLWLIKSEDHWPAKYTSLENENLSDVSATDLEQKSKSITQVLNVEVNKNNIFDYLFEKFSSFFKIQRIISYCFRFFNKIKQSIQIKNRMDIIDVNNEFLTTKELNYSKTLCIKWAQHAEFKDDIILLRQNKPLPGKSKLSTLNPYLDKDDILRVGGRLENSSCPFNVKHPIILPKCSILSKMIFQSTHIQNMHPGPSLLLHIVRQNYWVINSRTLSKQVVRDCITCAKLNAKPTNQLMGNLPASRIAPARAFSTTGVDYAGPIMISNKKGRGSKLIKSYIAVFVCFATKAIHLELVHELSTDAFILAFRRFIARRGAPSDMYSDNGTNFVGAKRKLTELYQLLKSNIHNKSISEYLTCQNIQWHFIPPAGPSFGGLWEAGVKSVKFHLIRTTTRIHLTFEEMSTLLCQIEALLNSRPLCARTEDITSLDILTPAHLLNVTSSTCIPEPTPDDQHISRLSRWQHIQVCVNNFWKKYSLEYLNTLQQRFKNKLPQQNLNVGDLVVIKDDNLPPSKWFLGRVLQTHPGSDGLVRVVTLKTATTTLKRPANKVCKLPVS